MSVLHVCVNLINAFSIYCMPECVCEFILCICLSALPACQCAHFVCLSVCLCGVCLHVCVCVYVVPESYTSILTWKDSACPYLALIFGSRMVARLVPLTVSRVPPLQGHRGGEQEKRKKKICPVSRHKIFWAKGISAVLRGTAFWNTSVSAVCYKL